MKNQLGGWKNRIIGEADIAPDQLLANPLNWRIHPKFQQDALRGVLKDVGWVQRVIVNQSSGNIIDGHLRVSLALRHGVETVPVIFVDLTEDEENEILATLDPLAAMAGTDKTKLNELLNVVTSQDESVMAMLSELSNLGKTAKNTEESEEPEFESKEEDDEGELESNNQAASGLQIGIWKPKWNKMRSTRFFSLRVWNLRDKKAELERYKHIKKSCAPLAINLIAEEFLQSLSETFQFPGTFANIIITNTPIWNGGEENQLKVEIAKELARKIPSRYEKLFTDRHLSGSNHPRNFNERGKITLIGPVASKIIILVDELVVSGVTIEESTQALVGNLVIPVSWIYENTEKAY